MSAPRAVELINSGDKVFIQGSTSIPETLVDALAARGPQLRDVTLWQAFAVAGREAPYCREDLRDSFLVNSFFVANSVRRWIDKGYGVTTPCFLGEVPALFRNGSCPVDVALINCSLPDENGYVSFGVSADLATSAVECARTVIAQINPRMPYSYGDALIHVSKLAAAVEVDDPLVEVPTPVPTDAERRIGEYIAQHIPDGATLQIGVGGIPNATLHALSGHRHLGIHTEALTDGLLPLIESGVIDNSCKTIHTGLSVASLALGSRRLYDFMDKNPQLLLKDVAYTNNPNIISRNPNMMAINSCLEIDLTGQVCADSLGTRIYSGIGGQHDFVYGASLSPGGHSFMAMLSTTSHGVSKIRPHLSTGAGVCTTRFQTDYVVTEYGIVSLRGKSLPQRARLLIGLAAPEFRDELTVAARQRFGHSFDRIY